MNWGAGCGIPPYDADNVARKLVVHDDLPERFHQRTQPLLSEVRPSALTRWQAARSARAGTAATTADPRRSSSGSRCRTASVARSMGRWWSEKLARRCTAECASPIAFA